jgi:hypothetical protein
MTENTIQNPHKKFLDLTTRTTKNAETILKLEFKIDDLANFNSQDITKDTPEGALLLEFF